MLIKQEIFNWYAKTFTFAGGLEWIQPWDLSGFNPGTIPSECAQLRVTKKPKLISKIDANTAGNNHLVCKNIYICWKTGVDSTLGQFHNKK